MKKTIIQFLTFSLLLTLILSCTSNQANNVTSNVNSPATTPTTVATVSESLEKIKFKTEGGADLFALKPRNDGAKLVDGKEQELARIKTESSGKIKIKDAQDKVLGYVINSESSWTVQSPDKKDLYILKRNGNNNYQLQDKNQKQIYQIQTNKTGLAISTAENKLVYQVRIKEGKISLRNTSGSTIFSTKSNISPIAFACFGLDELTREQQAALAYAVNLTGG